MDWVHGVLLLAVRCNVRIFTSLRWFSDRLKGLSISCNHCMGDPVVQGTLVPEWSSTWQFMQTPSNGIKTIWLLNPILIIELEWMQWLWILSRLWRTFHGTRLADDQAVGDNCVAIMGQHSTPQMPREVATRRVYIKAAFSLTLPWNMCFLVNMAVGSAIIINICLPF